MAGKVCLFMTECRCNEVPSNCRCGHNHGYSRCDRRCYKCECVRLVGINGKDCYSCEHIKEVHIVPEEELGKRKREADMKQRELALEERAAKHFKETVPSAFVCPISQEVMKDPVILVGSHITFDKEDISKWLEGNSTCPVTRKQLSNRERALIPNLALKKAIDEFRAA